MQRSTPGHATPQGGARSSTRAGASPYAEAIGPAGDAFEREADRAAEAVVRGGLLRAGSPWAAAAAPEDTIQRKCAECEEEEEEQIRRAPKDASLALDAPTTPSAGDDRASGDPPTAAGAIAPLPDGPAPASTDAGPSAVAQPLLVEDDAQAAPGQMRKSEFLATLRAEVCAAVDDGMSGTGRDSKGCPWIDHWFGFYENRNASQVERSLKRYVPEAGAGATAPDYIPLVAVRVRLSASRFSKTGAIEGVPEDTPGDAMAGGGVLGAFGGMFFKARPGGARGADPVSVRSELGTGQALPRPLRVRMESAFGASFGGVRIHVDGQAARVSDRLNARAFTIGDHVAFGGGEFRPGTFAGDALIAHELAHVVQQQGVPRGLADSIDSRRLEDDASASAAAATVRRAGRFGVPVVPRLRSGLSIQRCSKPSPAINLKAMSKDQLDGFINSHFDKADRKEAREILDDILTSDDDLRFADLEELSSEIHKRISTTRLMKKSQDLYGKAFEYPNHKLAMQCVGGRKNPRVNKAAEKYWGPVQNPEGTYYFDLSDEGKKDPYQALVTLFTPQKSICDMTLIHCDYLVSVVHFRAFADRIGIPEFNRRVAAGDIRMRLQWNGFAGIEEEGAPGAKGISLREMRPHSEKDLVIGDHVIFWNHRAYDAINQTIRNAWRLENAVLIEKQKGDDVFLGHGSGRKNKRQMHEKLAEEFNDVVKIAIRLIKSIAKGDSKAPVARTEMTGKFPNIHEGAGRWQITTARGKDFDVKEVKWNDPDLTGLRDPDDPSKMFPVKRPVESE